MKLSLLDLFRFKKRGRKRGFSATEMMVTVGIIGIMTSMLVPAVVNARRAAKRRTDYLQFRQYLMATAETFKETKHLEQPLLVELDFTYTDITFEDVRDMLGEMVYSSQLNGMPYPEMRYLEALDFSYTQFDDTWTEWVLPTPALKRLHLDGTKITDKTLEQIAGTVEGEFIYGEPHPMESLEVLTVFDCPYVTAEGVAALRLALPDAEIIRTLDEQQSFIETSGEEDFGP